jgi:hypothetical protein
MNVEKHETHRQLWQRLSLASGSVYGSRHPACRSTGKKFSFGIVNTNDTELVSVLVHQVFFMPT